MDIVYFENRCYYCRVRPATRLCDAPIGRKRYIGHPPRYLMEKAQSYNNYWFKVEMESVITCDKPICAECATSFGSDIDFCPDCMKRIRDKPIKYRRKYKR